MALDPKDVGELQRALNDAAGKASVLWTTFVLFQLYLAITFGSVTHRDLFLETSLKLPVLNVDLALVGFFAVAPTLLVIFHFYLFLQLLGLASKARDYNTLLMDEAPVASDRQYLRQRLDVFPILQFLAGPRDQRTGFRGFSLRLMAWITLVGTPVLILLQGQVTFLPYHLEWIVWLQRVTVLTDLSVIWYFWIHLRSEDVAILIRRVSSKVWMLFGGIVSLCVVTFSIYLATFPGEWLNANLPGSSLQALLFEGPVDNVSGRPRSLFSNRLVLTGQSFVTDHEKPDKIAISRSFRGRDLRSAVLLATDLRKANFRYAQLQGASLVLAQLQGAWLDMAQLQGARLLGAELQGASLYNAQLQGASLEAAQLQGASLEEAQLQGASLDRAQLQGASLDEAQLQGASLFEAQLQDVRGTPNVDLADLRNIDATPTSHSDSENRLPALDPTFWDVARSSQLQGEEGQRKRVEFLVNLACSKASVARGLMRNLRMDDQFQKQLLADGLRKRKSDPTACNGLIDLTDEDWSLLELSLN
jgi:uncharacterized protein YjbI with pentapeptide repeats